MLTDPLFLQIARGKERGGINPGQELLPQDLASRACDTSDMQDNLFLLYAVCIGMRARSILEIGTSDGTSTLALLKAAAENDGRVVSVDVAEVPVAAALVERLGLSSHWELHRGSSHEVLKTFRAQGRRFDVVLVDGDHSYSGAKEDVEDAAAMLVPGGVLFTHDNWCAAVDVDWNKPFGQRAIRGGAFLGQEMLAGSEWVGVTFPFGCNLGIFRRRADALREIDHNIEAGRKEGFFP